MSVRTDYLNYIPPSDGRKFKMITNADGTVSLTDATEYTQEGSVWGAGDANAFGEAINQNETNITKKADKSTTATATFLADGWGDAAPYQQTVEVAELAYGVDGTKPNGFAEWVHSTDADTEDALAKAWGFISYFEQGDGTMTAVCLKKVPTVDLPFEVLIVG